MKNTLQKGSAIVWLVIAVVLVAGIGIIVNKSHTTLVTSTPVNTTDLDCATYASKTEISSIFGVSNIAIETTRDPVDDSCQVDWTGSNYGHVIISQKNYQPMLDAITQTCQGTNQTANKYYTQINLHSIGVGDISCYFKIVDSPTVDFIVNNQGVTIAGDISLTEVQMVNFAKLIASRL